MNQRFSTFAIALLLLSVSFSSTFAQSNENTSVLGPPSAWSLLDFSQAAEFGGLQALFGEPKIRSEIPIAVRNNSETTLNNVRMSVETTDGDIAILDQNVWIYPLTLEPGAIGFGVAQFDEARIGDLIMNAPYVFADEFAEFKVVLLGPPENAEDVTGLQLLSVEADERGNLAGEIRNDTDSDVHEIWVYFLCIEDSGIVTDFGGDGLDRRLLAPGDVMEFESDLPDECGENWLITSMAEYRN